MFRVGQQKGGRYLSRSPTDPIGSTKNIVDRDFDEGIEEEIIEVVRRDGIISPKPLTLPAFDNSDSEHGMGKKSRQQP